VRERERERESVCVMSVEPRHDSTLTWVVFVCEREKKRVSVEPRHALKLTWAVFACERERERERETMCVCVKCLWSRDMTQH